MFSDYWGYCQQAELQLSVKLYLEFFQDKVSGFTFKIPICKGNNSQNEMIQCWKIWVRKDLEKLKNYKSSFHLIFLYQC